MKNRLKSFTFPRYQGRENLCGSLTQIHWHDWVFRIVYEMLKIFGRFQKTTEAENKEFYRKKWNIGMVKDKINKVIRPKSRAVSLSEKSGRHTDEQTKKTFEVATKSL